MVSGALTGLTEASDAESRDAPLGSCAADGNQPSRDSKDARKSAKPRGAHAQSTYLVQDERGGLASA